MGDALYISRQGELGKVLRNPTRFLAGIDVAVLDFDASSDPLAETLARTIPVRAVGGGADARVTEMPLMELRIRSERLVGLIGKMLRGFSAIADHQLSTTTLVALLVDRVAGRLRRAIRIRELCIGAGAGRLLLVHPASMGPDIIRFLSVGGLPVGTSEGASAIDVAPLYMPDTLSTLACPPLAEVLASRSAETIDLYVSAAHSDLYLLSVLPVLRHTLEHRPAILVLPVEFDISHKAKKLSLQHHLLSGRLRVVGRTRINCESVNNGPIWLREHFARVLLAYSAEPDSDEGAVLRGLLAEAAAQRLMPMIHLSATIQRQILPYLSRIASVVAAPGRLAEAMALVDVASVYGVPTYEIQAGPISARRALPPNARRVFCIADVSLRTYRDRFHVAAERLTVSGSPRIQELVAPWRRVSTSRAQALLGKKMQLNRRVLLPLATQPVGVPLCSAIVSIVLAACAHRPDVQVIVRPHPSEGADYIRAYEQLLAKEDGAVLAPGNIDPYVLLRASNWLVTYASTMGLEASELRIPVVVVNPVATRPPYDLAAGGLATEVRDADALLEALQHSHKPDAKRRGSLDAANSIAMEILSSAGGNP